MPQAEIYYNNSNGNLGIGTSSPAELLDVNGAFKVGCTTRAFRTWSESIPLEAESVGLIKTGLHFFQNF